MIPASKQLTITQRTIDKMWTYTPKVTPPFLHMCDFRKHGVCSIPLACRPALLFIPPQLTSFTN